MLVKDIMSKRLISIEPEDTLNHALGKMEANRVHQLLVMNNGAFYGMIELKKIVSRDIDIKSAKVENFASNVPHIDANASIESVVHLLLSSGMRALPVVEGGRVVGIISESDMMKVAKDYIRGLNQSVSSIISSAYMIDKNSNYGSVKRLIFEKNISRVPVVDGQKVLGVVSTMEMIKVVSGKSTMEVRGGTKRRVPKEKMRLEETPAISIMRPAAIVAGNKTIDDVIELLKTSEEAVVASDGGFGIITPKDLLELFASFPTKGVYVQITGMHDESIDFKARMDIAVTDFVKKMTKIVNNIEYFVVHIDKMRKNGAKQKYSIRARFKSESGFFVAHSWGWKPLDVINDLFKKLEREVMNKHEKMRTYARKRRSGKGR